MGRYLLILGVMFFPETSGHGRLMEPPARYNYSKLNGHTLSIQICSQWANVYALSYNLNLYYNLIVNLIVIQLWN